MKRTFEIKLIPLFSKLVIFTFFFCYFSLASYNKVGSQSSDTSTVSLTVNSTIAITASGDVNLGTITGSGDTGGTHSATWTVTTNDTDGYTVDWKSSSAAMPNTSGGSDTISAYTPAVSGTPETWSVATTDSEWGGRVSSTAECTRDIDFGTDSSSETWLNITTTDTQVCSTTEETDADGETVPVYFRAEVGSDRVQESGTYSVTVTLTATTL